jgi:hypothetical protein
MSQPQQPEQTITADQGWKRLNEVLSIWVPARLYHTSNVRKGLRNLKRGGR